MRAAALLASALALALAPPQAQRASAVGQTYRIDRVTDGDTVVLRNGQRVRLVQIDSPEVYVGVECYARRASAIAKQLLPVGTRVRLLTSLRPTEWTGTDGCCAT